MPKMQFRLWKNLMYLFKKIKNQKNKRIKNVLMDSCITING